MFHPEIDEVESLTAARAGALSGNEPSDALRVVNALLTQLDKLKHRKNVLVMSTSNLAQAIGAIQATLSTSAPSIVDFVCLGCRLCLYGSGGYRSIRRSSAEGSYLLDIMLLLRRAYACLDHY